MSWPAKWVTITTRIPTSTCSNADIQGFALCFLARKKLKTKSIENPQTKLIIMAVDSSKIITGTANERAKKTLATKVENVDIHTDLLEFFTWDSWETCMPKASEKESAMAIVSIPPRTANFEWVPALSPTIRPSVVIIPEVNPKLKPVSIGIRIQQSS
jgi:hypothetical protein